MSADERTRAFYEANAERYAAASQVGPHLADFILELPPHGRVLDLGCGSGQHSAALRDAGFAVTAWDASPALAAEAKRIRNIDVVVAEFNDLAYRGEFDGVWASGSLHHVRADELREIFRKIRAALKPAGVLHASLKANGADRRDAYGRFFCAMDEDLLAALAADWTHVSIERRHGAGYGGEPTDWLRLRARA